MQMATNPESTKIKKSIPPPTHVWGTQDNSRLAALSASSQTRSPPAKYSPEHQYPASGRTTISPPWLVVLPDH
ncbi:hypothetical protein GWI33_016950 [Rhynchophorus ferrugineus]|uniref:Uncharacterized protein n=1 Tax=Rhynchophorus ferrugineus TaxID=354439 RepID=A0A834M4G2_RHYFE|nr:hypothetical protein GWI33_016950 [Rhynchophorus ferrugineus]